MNATRTAMVVGALAAIVVLTAACNRVDDPPAPSPQLPKGAPSAAPSEMVTRDEAIARSAVAPDLSRFNDAVKRQLIDRSAWHRRVLETPDLPPDRRAAAHGELASLYHAYQLLDAAEPLYLEAETLSPREPRWPYYLGHLYRSRNSLESSAASFTRAISIDASFVPALVRLAEVEIDLGRSDQASQRLHAAVEIDPSCATAHFHLGLVAQAAGDPKSAVDSFARALELQPAANAIRRPLALALRDLGRIEEARRALEAAGDQAVSLPDPLMIALHRMSVSYWEKLTEGERLLREGRVEPALAALEEAIRHDPLAAPPRLLLGELLAQRGSKVEARRQLELAVFLSEKSADANGRLGRLWAAQGEFARAIEAYSSALEDEPGDGATWFDLAQAERRVGNLPGALAAAHRAADILTDQPIPLLFEVTLLVETGRCTEARSRLEQGLADSPHQGAWAHALARVLAACPDPAARDGKRALELASSLHQALPSPGHAGAVAQAMAETGDFAGALRWQEQAIALALESGRAPLARALERDRARFAAGAPSREPWPADHLELFGAGASSAR